MDRQDSGRGLGDRRSLYWVVMLGAVGTVILIGVSGHWDHTPTPSIVNSADPVGDAPGGEASEAAADNGWVTDREKRAHADDGHPTDDFRWAVGYFLATDYSGAGGQVEFLELERRWKRIARTGGAVGPDDMLRVSLSEVGKSTVPDGLGNLFEGHSLVLTDAALDEGRLSLDIAPGSWMELHLGTTGEAAAFNQIAALGAHFYPSAEEICILIEGQEAYLFSHGLSSCPHDLPD